ncbi:UDP-N-acetylmuramoyl-L-alanine--D-glutamate ligase [bacterium]|nr:UDP-N-acetylmuramoyl-L-alanine--D-glutamate ligase [bacterium]
MGAGRSGLAVAKLLKRKGALLFLSEAVSRNEKMAEVEMLEKQHIEAEFGSHSPRIFQSDFIVVSPGMDLSHPILQKAREKKIPIFGEIEVASWFCRAPIVAITGSNGKSTVTALLGEVFQRDKTPCIVAGNIGQPFSDYVEDTVSDGVAVLEVSSFQLESIDTFHPKVSVILNITEDHLDRHKTMEQYGRIKSRIFENQDDTDLFVFNGEDSRIVAFSTRARCRRAVFGVDDPVLDCSFVRQGALTLRIGGREELLLPIQEMKIIGDHNIANALSVALTARLMGIGSGIIRHVFRTFRGLPHRMEFVREIHGVKWIDDSKATNVFSVWYALGSYVEPVVLIAGGRDKNSDFSFLRKRIEEKTRGLVLIGEAAHKMEKTFRGLRPIVRADSLEEAVVQAQKMARRGDVVLLSPACASFDMFRDFEDRGNQFKSIVNRFP